MSKQMTLGTGFEKYSKTTRREKFLTEMDRIVPWGDLCALIAPVYPKAGDGRPPKELEMMLRVYFLQHTMPPTVATAAGATCTSSQAHR
jgi:IS5 family transposase